MTLADRLIAQGEARGEARGNWIGKIQVLEKLLGLPETKIAVLHGLGIDVLEQRHVALETDYDSRFKRG
jgi:hypothetical protein